jgi:hypothetical protein
MATSDVIGNYKLVMLTLCLSPVLCVAAPRGFSRVLRLRALASSSLFVFHSLNAFLAVRTKYYGSVVVSEARGGDVVAEAAQRIKDQGNEPRKTWLRPTKEEILVPLLAKDKRKIKEGRKEELRGERGKGKGKGKEAFLDLIFLFFSFLQLLDRETEERLSATSIIFTAYCGAHPVDRRLFCFITTSPSVPLP